MKALGYNESGVVIVLTLIYDDWYTEIWVDEQGNPHRPISYIKETMH